MKMSRRGPLGEGDAGRDASTIADDVVASPDDDDDGAAPDDDGAAADDDSECWRRRVNKSEIKSMVTRVARMSWSEGVVIVYEGLRVAVAEGLMIGGAVYENVMT